MKPRSDSVPAWPFALACLCVFAIATAARASGSGGLPAPRGVYFQTAKSHLLSLPARRLLGVWSDVRWGTAEADLQLGLRLHSGSGDVQGWLRNTNSIAVPYYQYAMASIAHHGVEVQRGSEWVPLPWATGWTECLPGVGPRPKDLQLLAPSARADLEAPTFSSSLHRFDWPPALLGDTNRVLFRVVYRVSVPTSETPKKPSGYSQISLRSAPEEVDTSHLVAMTKARRQP
jgi:hypothetical protein